MDVITVKLARCALLACLVSTLACGDSDSPAADGGARDATARDASRADAARPRDAAGLDAAELDAAQSDAARADPAAPDAARIDAAEAASDAAPADAAELDLDAAPADAAELDLDAAPADAAPGDAAQTDAALETGPDPDGDEDGGGSDAGPNDAGPDPSREEFAMRVVALDLESPWEILWGPDGRLWITERDGLRVIRVDPASGEATIALEVPDAHQSSGQDGVLGLALDARLGDEVGADYVYLAYTYDVDAGAGVDRRAKIVRYTYDSGSETLSTPFVLIENLPASNDHNSGRLVYGPDDRLYYTIGDQGRNQFDNKCESIQAQTLPSSADVTQEDWPAYQGKILRLELDGSIPADNPVLAGVRSHVYSYGHRNAQGIAFGPDGKLYAAEQGPKTDDEINLITKGGNYGWPHIAGFQDDKAYVYGNWSAASDCDSIWFSDYDLPPSVPRQAESEWSSADYAGPLKTFYTVDSDFDFTDPACPTSEFICWPTIAPSSLDVYVAGSGVLSSWGTSLLLTSLKEGSVFRVRLGPDGTTTEATATELFKTTNRYRDLAIAPDQRTFYVVTDSYGATSGPSSGSTQTLAHRGAILEFKLTD